MMELDVRQKESLLDAYRLTNEFVTRSYLDKLTLVNMRNEVYDSEEVLTQVRILKINQIAYDKEESTMGKLMNVYNALYDAQGGIALILNGTKKGVDFYLGVRTLEEGNAVILQKTLEKSIRGNFPGCDIQKLDRDEMHELLENMTTSTLSNTSKVVSTVTGVAALKDEDKDAFVQGIEKFIETMRGETYTALLLADAITKEDLASIRRGYENIYTQMSPFATTDLTFGDNESTSITEGLSKGFTETTSENLSQTQTFTQGRSTSKTTGTSDTHSTNKGAVVGMGAAAVGGLLFGPAGAIITGGIGSAAGSMLGSDSRTTNESSSFSSNESKSYGESQSHGVSQGQSMQTNESTANTSGQSRSLQIKMENKTTKELLNKIEAMLERIKEGENLGMWNSAAYFIADDVQTAKVASSAYAAIIRGQKTSVEGIHINLWDQEQKVNLNRMLKSLKALKHPILNMQQQSNMNIPNVTPGTLVTTNELAIQMGWPRKSVQGLSVLEYAEFSRDIVTYEGPITGDTFRLGQVYHMGRVEETAVHMDVESLSMHTFITGSTGSGKSNTIYYLLKTLKEKKQIPFLVIEPAKGEYKNVFGGYKDVTVLGTNPYKTKLLKINPFAFPEDIHVLEHIDRLTEIFNICWPMYAAMPAVLKEAIERAYIQCGWDLEKSINQLEERLFPTFIDLLETLPEVIEESAYSEELKGNYIGSLVTRVKSLTNGLNGSIFSSEEVESEILFDSSCIVDLSRVGNTETKALIMGILMMRLQEYRISSAKGGNEPLKHITVLEEAHNLLKRTSTEQSGEGSNILGKAVEMLGNAIAEMRTYGEGFIIADQAPGLLDLSVIRNTNTKIILRLPDESDRELVGKAAGLNEEQIKEIVKFRRGVAAVYQNNWIQPVLCQIDKFEGEKPYVHQASQTLQSENIKGWLVKQLIGHRLGEKEVLDMDLEQFRSLVLKGNVSGDIKRLLLEKEPKALTCREMEKIINKLVLGKQILKEAVDCENLEAWNKQVTRRICETIGMECPPIYEQEIIRTLLKEFGHEDAQMEDFYNTWEKEVSGHTY